MTSGTSTESPQIKAAIKNFVLRAINIPELNDDDDLFDSGLVNSLFAVQLMTFIEKTFKIDVDADDLDMRNFRSLNAATEFVVRKNGAKAA